MEVTFQDVKEAAERIRPYINRTPILTCTTISDMATCHLSSDTSPLRVNLFFKCENFQKVGAFKYRGATNSVLRLLLSSPPSNTLDGKPCVITHSSGNHAQALALAGTVHGLESHIIMPSSASSVKRSAVQGYGGIVHTCDPTLEARESTTRNVKASLEGEGKKVTVIPPYDYADVIAGQGTAALEMIQECEMDDLGPLDVVMTPVGGGGLLAGTALTVKGVDKGVLMVAGEPLGADDAHRSFYGKKLVPSINPQTIADGLLTSLGELNFKIICENVDAICTVTETQILQTTKLVWERMKIVIEPSSAVPLAVVLYSSKFKELIQAWNTEGRGKGRKNINIGIVFSGGNVDFKKLGDLFDSLPTVSLT